MLSNAEIDVLLEALDAWVMKDLSGEMLGDVLGIMFSRDPETHAKTQAARDQNKAKLEDDRTARRIQANRLKAKLAGMMQP